MTTDTTELIPACAAQIVPRQPADRSPALVYLARLAPGSRRGQAHALRVIAAIIQPGADPATFAWWLFDYQHSQAVRARLAEHYAPAMANKCLSALRAVLKETWRLGLMTAEQYQRAADVGAVRGQRLAKGRALPGAEVAALLKACDTDPGPIGIRDAAIVATLYACGLRRAECVSLDMSNYDPAAAEVRVIGKGNKERAVPVADFAVARLGAWLRLRPEAGPLFTRVYKSRITEDRLSDQAIRLILAKRCKEAGIANAAPHDMRRSMVSSLLDAGVDLSTVQQLAGHSNVATTARYDRRGDQAKRRAVQHLRV